MKKIIFILMTLLISVKVSESTIVMDMDTKRVIYESNMNEVKLIASTTKIMTALVTINNSNLNDTITIDESILQSTGSNIYIEIGEKITIENLLYGLMLRSGNDAAIALANYVGGSMEGFVTLMNETAASIGMTNTKFINSTGLEDNLGNGNTSTSYDLALLMSHAMQNKTFRTITQTKTKVAKTSLKTYHWTNKNKLLFNYEHTTGGKTGYTKKAYRTLVTSASKDNKNLTIVTLNQANDFEIHKNLYEEYFNKYKIYNIINSNKFLKEENKYINKDFNMLLTEDEYKRIKIDIINTKDITNRVGYVTVSLDNKIYFKESIYKLKEKKKSIITKIKEFLWNIFQ